MKQMANKLKKHVMVLLSDDVYTKLQTKAGLVPMSAYVRRLINIDIMTTDAPRAQDILAKMKEQIDAERPKPSLLQKKSE